MCEHSAGLALWLASSVSAARASQSRLLGREPGRWASLQLSITALIEAALQLVLCCGMQALRLCLPACLPALCLPAMLTCLGYLPHSPAGAVSCLQQAVSLYTDMGRLGMAARQLRVGAACWELGCLAVCALGKVLVNQTLGACQQQVAPWQCCCSLSRAACSCCARCVCAVLLMLCRAVLTLLAVLQEIAEVLEKEGDKEESIMFYEQAGDLFSTENSTAEANKCNLKVWRVGMRKEGGILHSQCLTVL